MYINLKHLLGHQPTHPCSHSSRLSAWLASWLASKSSFVLPSARTNYKIFSLKFQGPKTWNSIDESLKSCSISAFLKKTQKSLYQPILNNLFLFLALTNTPIYPTSYIFCVCVRVCVCVCLSVCLCVPACLTDPIITPFNYITLN